MKKFIAFWRVAWQVTIAYRAESAVWFLIEALPLIPMISLWQFLLKIGRIDERQASNLTFYYVMTLVISRLFSSHFESWKIEEIKNGSINKDLLKPFSLKVYLLANEGAFRISGILFIIPTLILVSPLLLYGPGLDINPAEVVAVLLILALSFFHRFFVSWLIMLAAFWITQAKALSHLKWMFEGILGGAWLPLSFFPVWWQLIAKFSPFYYWYHFPINIIVGNFSRYELITGIVLSGFWLVILVGLGEFVWRKALQRYSAIGG